MIAGQDARVRAGGKLVAAVLMAVVLAVQPFVPMANFLGTAHAAAVLNPTNVFVGTTVSNPADAEGTEGNPFASLTEAYSAVAAGGKMTVMPGTYHQAANLVISKQITIKGQAGAKITTSGTSNVFTITAVGTVISDLIFQKTDSATQNMIGVQASNVVIKDNDFSGQYTLGDGEVSRAMVTSSGAFNTIITGNSIANLRQPAYLNDGSGGSITNNYLTQSRGWVVEKSSFFSFSNNTWGTNAVDIAIIPGAGMGINSYPCSVTNGFKVQNNNANVENQVANCTVDTVAPSVPGGGQPHNTVKKTNTFNFTWNESTDNQPGNISYEFQSSLNPAQSGGVLTTGLWKSGTLPNPTILSTGAPDGTWYWQVRAVDAAGNKSAWSPVWNVTLFTAIDNKKPVVELSAPNTGTFNPTNITVNATDNLGLHKVTANIYDKSNKVLQKSCSKTAPAGSTSYTLNCAVSGLEDGIYTIRANASDLAGNVSQTILRQFAIDNSVPTIEHTSEGLIPAEVSGTQTFTFKITEEYPALITAALNDGPKEPQSAPTTMQEFPEGFDSIDLTINVDTTKLQDGPNKLAIDVTDYAGNVAETKVVNFTVKNNPGTTPPEEEPPVEEPPIEEPGEGENGGSTPSPGGTSGNGGSSNPQPIELIAAFNGGSASNNTTGSFTTPAPATSSDDSSSDTPEDGEVLGTQAGNSNNTGSSTSSKSQEGLAWYWWLAIGAGGLAAWLGIAALSRRLRAGEA